MIPLHREWCLDEGQGTISRTFRFANFYRTMAFANAVGWIAHQQDHHPLLQIDYNTCRVSYSTHSAGGLTDKDFTCAGLIDALQGDE